MLEVSKVSQPQSSVSVLPMDRGQAVALKCGLALPGIVWGGSVDFGERM